METIILASGSPRREDYFRLLGLPFRVIRPAVDETLDEAGDFADNGRKAAERLALLKANSVRAAPDVFGGVDAKVQTAGGRAGGASWIVAADTVISLDGRLFGKPKDRTEARKMLGFLQGRGHQVVTAIVLVNARESLSDCRAVVSEVDFAAMSGPEIEWYLDSGEWEGAAGAYKIQGLAACFVRGIRGSYSSIVGLPLRELYCMLRANGYPYGESSKFRQTAGF